MSSTDPKLSRATLRRMAAVPIGSLFIGSTLVALAPSVAASPPAVVLSPAISSVAAGETATMTARVSGLPDTTCLYGISASGGFSAQPFDSATAPASTVVTGTPQEDATVTATVTYAPDVPEGTACSDVSDADREQVTSYPATVAVPAGSGEDGSGEETEAPDDNGSEEDDSDSDGSEDSDDGSGDGSNEDSDEGSGDGSEDSEDSGEGSDGGSDDSGDDSDGSGGDSGEDTGNPDDNGSEEDGSDSGEDTDSSDEESGDGSEGSEDSGDPGQGTETGATDETGGTGDEDGDAGDSGETDGQGSGSGGDHTPDSSEEGDESPDGQRPSGPSPERGTTPDFSLPDQPFSDDGPSLPTGDADLPSLDSAPPEDLAELPTVDPGENGDGGAETDEGNTTVAAENDSLATSAATPAVLLLFMLLLVLLSAPMAPARRVRTGIASYQGRRRRN
ncbi:hypothetical protein FHX37_4266 [Haloactinospora alba]|uniref:Uncharacterized protein n=1 Tax=Haloactinospora alba TaxID=405555 RepID=A0A543N6T1_9ACTN|nr:hypothetical protein [Haloactinospora alba]TQN27545.1 hypothetical protein FHX37_4266 [Haloactinospora alba]